MAQSFLVDFSGPECTLSRVHGEDERKDGGRTLRIIVVLTNSSKLGDSENPTGWYLPELAHPLHEFDAASVEYVLVTPEGGEAPLDPSSLDPYKEDAICQALLKDEKIMEDLKNTKSIGSLDHKDYDGIFFVGGYGTMFDFPDHDVLNKTTADVYENGGVVSAVCHGPAGLLNVKLSNGDYLLKGKAVTGFSNAEEDVMGLRDHIPYTLPDILAERGGNVSNGDTWGEHVVTDGRLVTGQNPASSTLTAKQLIAALSKRSKRVVVVLTNSSKLGDSGNPTGWYLPELAHPLHELKAAGIQCDIVTPEGGEAPLDPSSLDPYKEDTICQALLDDEKLMAELKDTKSIADINPKNYDGIFFVGGYGTMFDFPNHDVLNKTTADLYENGGVVSAVCHGPAGLLNVKLSNGEYLLNGKDVTGFSNAEEDVMGLREHIPYTLPDKLADRGGKVTNGDTWAEHVVTDGRLITGQNPASSTLTAKQLIAALS